LWAEVAARRGLTLTTDIQVDLPPTPCDPALVTLLQDISKAQGIPHLTMSSGAGHDSQQMAAVCPVVMIFVRSEGGRSHTPEEYSTIPDIMEGIRLLMVALHKRAY
jgi:allantoate deiminase